MKSRLLLLAVAATLTLSGCAGNMPANTVGSINDLTGKQIGVVTDSASSIYATMYGTVHTYDDAGTMLAEVKSGKIDCAVMEQNAEKKVIGEVRGLRALPDAVFKGEYCFAIAKENPDLKQAVNDALKTLKKAGVIDVIRNKYLYGKGQGYKSPDGVDHSKGTLTLAVDESFAPFAYKDSAGNMTGFDVELTRAVCDLLGCDLTVIVAEHQDLVTDVQYGKADFALSGVTNNDTDAKLVDFSDPYIKATQVVIVRR